MRHDGEMRALFQIAIVFAALLAVGAPHAFGQVSATCKVETRSGLAWEIHTGCAEVPLDPSSPDGPSITLYYELSRPKGPSMGVILNFHGGPGYPRAHIPERGFLWQGLLAHYTFLYFHQRGSGWSGRLETLAQLQGIEPFYSLDAIVEDGRALLDQLAPGQPVIVFGKSAGGFASMMFALRYPDRVARAVLACTGPDGDYLRKRDQITRQFMAEMDIRFPGFAGSHSRARRTLSQTPPEPLLMPDSVSSASTLLESAYFDLSYSVRGQYEMVAVARDIQWGEGRLLAQRLRKGQANLNGGGLESPVLLQHISCRELGHGELHPFACMGVSRDVSPYDVKPRLHELTMPVLVVSGQHDSVLPVSQQQAIVDNLTSAPTQWAVFRWSGHMVFEEQPRASGEVILRFLGIEPPQKPQDSGL